MKLKVVKQGMVCKLRSGESITVLDSGYFFTSGLIISTMEEKYSEDLTHKRYKQLDIMEVSFGNEVVFKRNESIFYVPEVREKFFYTNDFGEITSRINMQMLGDTDILNNNRVFKTEEEAEKRLRQQKATLSVERWIAENDVEVDVFDKGVAKYFIVCGIEDKELGVDCYNLYIATPKQFILSSVEKGLQLIKEREKELKIMFGVEE